jgi:glycosyltransferase involved in cell wall biosynthesis
MKILIITQYFYPENFKSNDLAWGLSQRGLTVDVLTGIPNYPEGKYYKGYGQFKKRCQIIDGVRIYRAFLYSRGSGSGFRLALNYFSFAFFSSLWVMFFFIFKRYDAILVHEPSPITQGIPAVILKKIKKTPLYFWVLDLWPESIIHVGGIKNRKIITFIDKITKTIYENSDKILISSKGFRDSIIKKGDYNNKIIYFPNWGEDIFINGSEFALPSLPEGFRIVFAGSIGEAQDFESILKAAKILNNFSEIKWILAGDGRKVEWINNYINENNLLNVHLIGRLPLSAMPSLFKKSDVMLVSLRDMPIFNITVPAKIQAYMAASKPIIAMLNGEGANIISEAGCGISVDSGDYKGLSESALEMFRMKKNKLGEMGNSGFNYYAKHFSKKECIDNLYRILSGR